jgi:putative MFS transporter
MFLLGGAGAAICWLLRRALPESPRWLEAVGRQEEADAIVARLEAQALRENGGQELPVPDAGEVPRPEQAPMRELFGAAWRKRTVMLWIFHCLQTFGYYGFGTLVPLILAAKGFTIGSSLMFSAVTFLGYPIGSLLSIPVIERLERKTLVMAGALAMAVFGLAFGYSGGTTAILVFGFCYTAASNLFANAFHVYQAELYPTGLRATGAGAAYSLSRLATAAMPFLLLPLLDDEGPGALFAMVAAAMVVLVLDVGLLGPRTTGLALEELTDSRFARSPGRPQPVG